MKKLDIYNTIERLSELLRVNSRKSGLEFGLHPIQLEALHYLSICNKFSDTPMAVTEYLGLTKGTVSQTLKILETKKYIVKLVDKNDKRKIHLIVTKQGKMIIKKLHPTSFFTNAMNKLSQQESKEIAISLKKLLSIILVTNRIKPYGVCNSCFYNHKNLDGSYLCKLIEQPLKLSDTKLICREFRKQA